ncbi:MAG: copper chaperone [Candidatus Devosia symbiotica]|nr:copper chaperone [Candidatus Devosia symbiotica]
MTCNHFVGTISKTLEEALPGAEIAVDLATHRIAFTGDRAKGEEAIREAGYTSEAA